MGLGPNVVIFLHYKGTTGTSKYKVMGYLIDSTLSRDDDEDRKLIGFEATNGGGCDTAKMSRDHRQQFGPETLESENIINIQRKCAII